MDCLDNLSFCSDSLMKCSLQAPNHRHVRSHVTGYIVQMAHKTFKCQFYAVVNKRDSR